MGIHSSVLFEQEQSCAEAFALSVQTLKILFQGFIPTLFQVCLVLVPSIALLTRGHRLVENNGLGLFIRMLFNCILNFLLQRNFTQLFQVGGVDLSQGLFIKFILFQGLVALRSHGWSLHLIYKTEIYRC